MKNLSKNKKPWLIGTTSFTIVAILLLAWLYGWGGDDINVMNFDADDVVSIKMGATLFEFEPFVVTDKEDIETVIDKVNGLQYAGKSIRQVLKYGLFSGGSVLYEFGVELTTGEEFYFCIAVNKGYTPGEDVEGSYWGSEHESGNMCKGSIDWFYALHEKHTSELTV